MLRGCGIPTGMGLGISWVDRTGSFAMRKAESQKRCARLADQFATAGAAPDRRRVPAASRRDRHVTYAARSPCAARDSVSADDLLADSTAAQRVVAVRRRSFHSYARRLYTIAERISRPEIGRPFSRPIEDQQLSRGACGRVNGRGWLRPRRSSRRCRRTRSSCSPNCPIPTRRV